MNAKIENISQNQNPKLLIPQPKINIQKRSKKSNKITLREPQAPQTSRGRSIHKNQKKKLLAFPIPSPGSFLIKRYNEYLTVLEENEITNYTVYFLRKYPPEIRTSDPITPRKFQFVPHEHIYYRFEMLDLLGKGSFGGVIKCFDHKNNQEVAIKFLRNRINHHDQIQAELRYTQKLQLDNGPENHHIVKFKESFEFRGYIFLVEELLDLDLYKILQRNNFHGLRISVAKLIVRDLAVALQFSHDHGIVHCDVKPENILFTTKRHLSVKLIDYGCSCPKGENPFTYIQSRYYRAPEIVMGLEYGPEIDVWSLGCVLYEILTGKVLFEGEDEYELIQMHMALLGVPPNDMISNGDRAGYYFNDNFEPILQPNDAGKIHTPGTHSLEDIIPGHDKTLFSLFSGCFQWRSSDRLTPQQIINHPWLSSGKSKSVVPPSSSHSARRPVKT